MSNRPLAIASLLMIATALGAGPALADGARTLPFTGPPPEVTEPDVGLTVLHTPRGVTHDEDAPAGPLDEPTPTDIEELLRDYSTVTISPGGTTTVSAPSAALRSVIEEEYAAGRI